MCMHVIQCVAIHADTIAMIVLELKHGFMRRTCEYVQKKGRDTVDTVIDCYNSNVDFCSARAITVS